MSNYLTSAVFAVLLTATMAASAEAYDGHGHAQYYHGGYSHGGYWHGGYGYYHTPHYGPVVVGGYPYPYGYPAAYPAPYPVAVAPAYVQPAPVGLSLGVFLR